MGSGGLWWRRIAPAPREWAYNRSEGFGGRIYRLGCPEGVKGQNERAGAAWGLSRGEWMRVFGWIRRELRLFFC